MTRPRILITLDTGVEDRRGVPFPSFHMKAAYAASVERAGGTPVLAAPTLNQAVIRELLGVSDGVVITGGAFDIDPSWYGRAPASVRLDAPKTLRTSFEWALLDVALASAIPVLGVCGGMQLLNVALGGTLIQDITSEVPGALEHEQPTSPALAHHPVRISPGTAFHVALGADVLQVNSTHHQAVMELGSGLAVLARSFDGVVEAVGRANDLALFGVQWHPELMDDEPSRALYRAFVEEADLCRRRET